MIRAPLASIVVVLLLLAGARCPGLPPTPNEGGRWVGEGEFEGEGEGDGEGEGEGDGEGEGEPPPDGSCTMDADCADIGGACASPDDPPACGIPPPDFDDECAHNLDCVGIDGTVCDLVDDGCGGSHLDCVPACGGEPSCVSGAQCDCAAGEACNLGRCEAVSCQSGSFMCATHRACGATAPDPLADDRDHGCVPIPCANDGDCPFGPWQPGGLVVVLGYCVNGACASGPGYCSLPVP